MAWSFDVASNIPRLNQSGTETGLAGIATAIGALASVARSTAYTTSQMVKPPTPTGFWYRCSTAGTTAASAPTYGTTLAGTTTDGTAVFTAFKAPDIQTLGTTNHYYMPDIRMAINGTLTNANPQQQNFTCFDLIIYTGNFTSGAWASDGVTPRWDGLHFASVRTSGSGADGVGMTLQAGGQFTFIGGEVQTANGVTFENNTTPRSYLTRWRNTREYGASSARFRSYTTLAIFQNVETYDFAFDLFRMPTVPPSIKARGSEYVYQYVGAGAGGADAKFAASNLENVDGTYDFDNYFGGWVELYNCAKGASLSVVSQYPGSSVWVRHCVPLYQDIAITAKNTAGAVVQDVRFTATESPTNSPTVTFTTASGLKTWDFRTPLSYQTTTDASGIATSSPVLNVWYWQTSFKQSLRFPSSTATYEGRAYGYKSTIVSVVLGASAAIPVSAGMISRDTATVLTRAAALAQTGITFAASGATGGTVTVSANKTLQEIWDYYNAWIIEFANRPSNDTWTCVAGNMSMGAWSLVVNSGVTLTGSGNVTSFSTTATVTNNGSITGIYTSSAGTSTNLELRGIKAGASYIAANNSTTATILFGTNATGSTQTYTVRFPPGSTGLQVYVARQGYGDQFDFEVITLVPGVMWYQFIDIPDEGITQTNLSTVLGYATIEDYTRLYDRVCAHRTTEAGIKLGNIVVRAGTQLQFGSYSGRVKYTAASAFSITGNTITVKASALAGTTRYDTIVATPPATWVGDTTEEINGEVEDANGDSSVNIQAAGISTFEVWKIADATDPDDYATGTLLDTVGIGKYRFLHADGFKMVIRDTTTNFRVVSEMEKGTYTAALFFGASVQLAQAAEVSEINNKMDALQIDVTNIPAAVWAFIVETGHSALAMMRLMASVLVGKVSGAGTGTEVFRDLGDTKDRVISSVDENGNRTDVTKDAS